ncbi:hypothetical protein [Lysinibacillus xylanilyticus]|uniref:hypothetical protein n=1 Tax=Lysinibacillus xylanilyticus TaxID=582475 RepID=UPI003812A26D
MMAENILLIILMIPLYGSIIWSYFYPEESLLFGKRWMYKKEPELSNTLIRYTKFTSMIGMIGLPIIVIGFIFDILILKLTLAVFISVVVIGALIIFTDDKDS